MLELQLPNYRSGLGEQKSAELYGLDTTEITQLDRPKVTNTGAPPETAAIIEYVQLSKKNPARGRVLPNT